MFIHILLWLLAHCHHFHVTHVHVPCSIKHEKGIVPPCKFR